MSIFEVEVFKVFLLVLVRFSGLLLTAPVLGSSNFPIMAKVGLAMFAALVVTPVLPAQPDPLPDSLPLFAVMGLGELVVGLSMGFVMTVTFAAIQVAGQVMDMMTGFAMVNVFNPAMETQVPVFGFFFFLLAALYLLALDGHHLMIEHLVRSFDTIPLGGPVLRPEVMYQASLWGRVMFLHGLMIAAPLGSALFMAYVTMGLMTRVVPQIHLFVVGFPLTVGLGLLMASLVIEVYISLLYGLFNENNGLMWRHVVGLVEGMSSA